MEVYTTEAVYSPPFTPSPLPSSPSLISKFTPTWPRHPRLTLKTLGESPSLFKTSGEELVRGGESWGEGEGFPARGGRRSCGQGVVLSLSGP